MSRKLPRLTRNGSPIFVVRSQASTVMSNAVPSMGMLMAMSGGVVATAFVMVPTVTVTLWETASVLQSTGVRALYCRPCGKLIQLKV